MRGIPYCRLSSGEVPAALGNLSNLKLLRVSDNELTGTIPPALGNLSSLTRLYLYENQLTGGLPTELYRLTKLEVLDLSHNQLSGAIPEALFATGSAASVPYPHNREIAAEVALPINVAYIEPGLRLSEASPPQQVFLSSLRVLNLSHNRLSGTIPSAVSRLATLQRAYFNNNLFQVSEFHSNNKQMASGKFVRCTAEMEAQGRQNDKEALAKLYEFTDGRPKINVLPVKGPQWTNHDGWEDNFKGRPGKQLDQWYGVKTNAAGRVIELNLGNNNLEERGNKPMDHWARHITGMNNDKVGVRGGCKYPLFWLEKLDFGDNKLDGNIGAVLGDIRFQSGTVIEVDLAGDRNKWNPEHISGVDFKDLTEVKVPDNYQLADDLEEKLSSEKGITIKISSSDIAKAGVRIITTAAKNPVSKLVFKNAKHGLGPIGSILEHDAIVNVIIGLLQGKDNRELAHLFLDGLGVPKDNAVRDIYRGCSSAYKWNVGEQRCVSDQYDTDYCINARNQNLNRPICE